METIRINGSNPAYHRQILDTLSFNVDESLIIFKWYIYHHFKNFDTMKMHFKIIFIITSAGQVNILTNQPY